MLIAAGLLVLAVVLPPLVVRRLRRSRGTSDS
jgi:hypothetical protein